MPEILFVLVFLLAEVSLCCGVLICVHSHQRYWYFELIHVRVV